MKSYFAIILIIGIFGITGLGFLGMTHETGHGLDCFAVKLGGSDCSIWKTLIESLALHVNVIKSVSSAPLVSMFFVLFLLFGVLWIFDIVIVSRYVPSRAVNERRERIDIPSGERSKREIRSWLARREHSPDIR